MGLGFGLAVAILGAYQILKLPPVLPEMLDLYGYSELLAGAFMSVFALIGLLLSMRIGRAMTPDQMHRWILVAAGLIILGALPILAVPTSGSVVLIGRVLEGVATAVLAIAGPTLMIRATAPQHRNLAAGLAATWIPIGGLVASFIARVGGGWSVVWWAGVVYALFVASWVVIAGRGSRRAERLGARLGARREVGKDGPKAPTKPLALEAKEKQVLALGAICFCLWAFQNMAVLTWLPEYLVDARLLSTSNAQELFGMTIATLLIANLSASVLLRWGIPLPALLILALLGQALALVVGPFFPSTLSGIAVLSFYGFMAGLTPTCLFGLPNTILGADRSTPAAFGQLMTGRSLGVLIGPIAVAALATSGFGWDIGWYVTAAASVLGAGSAALIWRAFMRS